MASKSACSAALAALWTLSAALAGCAANGSPSMAQPLRCPCSPLHDSRQLVLVVSDNWDATSAHLQCYARAELDQPWQKVGPSVPVSLGRTGLAWGRGLYGQPSLPGPIKREGDGKAPAGAFDLPLAFGYAGPEAAGNLKLPYLPLTADVVGVDDVKSRYYNQLVHVSQTPAKDWDSAETMLRPDGLYEWGVFVNHNVAPPAPGAGSCIFLHIWRGPGQPTAGCTAMSRDEMVRIVSWLDAQAKPVLVQLPQDAFQRLAKPWALPPD